MATLRSFAQRMRAYATDIPRQVNEIKKEVVREIVTQVVPDTPVKTGQARSGYITSIGEPDTSTLPVGPFTKDGAQSIARMAAVLPQIRPGDKVSITNNVDYIGDLNSGSSRQAPAQFVETAVARAEAIIARQVIRFGG